MRRGVRIYGPDGSQAWLEPRVASEMQLFDGERVRTDHRMLEILTANAAFLLKRSEDSSGRATRLVPGETNANLSELLINLNIEGE